MFSGELLKQTPFSVALPNSSRKHKTSRKLFFFVFVFQLFFGRPVFSNVREWSKWRHTLFTHYFDRKIPCSRRVPKLTRSEVKLQGYIKDDVKFMKICHFKICNWVGAQNSNFGGDFLRQNTILSQIDGYLYIISTAHTTLSIVWAHNICITNAFVFRSSSSGVLVQLFGRCWGGDDRVFSTFTPTVYST